MIIDQEFKTLIPALMDEEYNQLEENLLQNGIREPLSVWGDILIDGHNRYDIAQKHGLEYSVKAYEFDSRNDVIFWIIKNQFGRRNISNYNRALLAIKLKPVIAEKAKENQIKSGLDYGKGSQKSVEPIKPVDTQKELAKMANVSHDTIARVEKIESKASPEVIKRIQQGDLSINKAYQDIRREEKRTEIKISPPKPVLGKYNVVYCDPPWKYEFSETENRAIENQYPTMTLQEIKALNIPSDDDSVLIMWATAPKLEEAISVLNAWGFSYRTCAVWDKEKIGMGYWFRGQHEILLIGVKGKFHAPDPENRVSSVYREARTQHSKKPCHYYDLIEKMFPNGKYLELFSRNKYSEKWEVWGNQA